MNANKLRKAAITILYAIQIALAFWLGARIADVRLEHYEDGSGEITWCLPDQACE